MDLKKIRFPMMTATALLLCAAIAFAAAPNLLNYQGRLTTPGGTPVVDNSYAVTFSIYSVASGGSALWTETQAVTTAGGIFSTVLGTTIPFSEDLFSDSTRYLGIKVGADPEISPRTRLTSVPYARGADNGWRDGGSAILQNNTFDFVGIGTTNPIRPLHVNEPSGYLFVSRMESSHPDATVTEISNTSANAIWEVSVAGVNGIPFWGIQPGDMYFYKQGTLWPAATWTSGGNLGLSAAYPRARLEAATNDTIAGLFSAAAPTSATHVLHAQYTGTGTSNAVAVYGKSAPADYYGTGGYFIGGFAGVRGLVDQDGPNAYYGVTGSAWGDGSGDKHGVYGGAVGATGTKYGVFGEAIGNSGDRYGLYGLASGSNSDEIIGVAGAAFGNGCRGMYAYSYGANSWGIFAEAEGDDAVGLITNSFGGNYNVGIEGTATGTGSNYAVRGYASGGTANWAGWFGGNVNILGTLSKAGGAFRIDHPLDPENKYLQHSFVESPDMMNIYNGNVVTDASGNASISLPNWFEALNKDFRYQLTVIGQFAQAIVSSKVSGIQFSIKTDKPNVEVSWQVTGIRKDVYAEQNRIQVEVDKDERERGKYVAPEAYGKGREFGIGYRKELKQAPRSIHTPTEDEKLKVIER